MGGLARDSDEPMPRDLQNYIQENWRRIESVVPGTEFNYEFWTRCGPRRSTYPSCRAVLAARHFDPSNEGAMIEKIQIAYYREAKNPSDVDTLCELAGELGIDTEAFREFLLGEDCQAMLDHSLQRRRELGVTAFPSLVLESDQSLRPIPHDFSDPGLTLGAIGAAQEAG